MVPLTQQGRSDCQVSANVVDAGVAPYLVVHSQACRVVSRRLNGYHEGYSVLATRKDGSKSANGKKTRYKCVRCVKSTTIRRPGCKPQNHVQPYFAGAAGSTTTRCRRCRVALCKHCWDAWHKDMQIERPTLGSAPPLPRSHA